MNVYDFDNTIYDGESFVDLFLMVLREDPGVLRFAPQMISGVIQYKAGKIDLDKAMLKWAPLFEGYVSQMEDVRDVIKRFWDTHQKKIKPFYDEIRREDDIIISASPVIVLEEIGCRIGLKNVIGSDIDPDTGKIGFMCFKDNKVKAFRKAYPDAVIDTFYTDSMNDKPMMDISKHVVMVKGSKLKQIK